MERATLDLILNSPSLFIEGSKGKLQGQSCSLSDIA